MLLLVMRGHEPLTIKDLYPEFNDEQLAEAEANLQRFGQVLLDIFKERTNTKRVTALTDGQDLPNIQDRASTTNIT